MRTSATGSKPNGFTLVELLVVLVIIGIMSAAVLIAIPDPRGRLIDEAERFAARVVTARDLAVIESRDMSVRVTAQGYAFDRRMDGEWRPVDAKPFRSQPWTNGTTALVGSAGQERVSFDSTGLASAPLTVTLVRSGERATISLAIDGKVSIDA